MYVLIEAGQVAVVTGAAQGLGRALAAGLIDCGVSVVLADTATERLQTTAEEFTARGGQVLPVITDVSDAAAVDALASTATASLFASACDIKQSGGVVIRQLDSPLYLQTDTSNDIIFRISVITEKFRIGASALTVADAMDFVFGTGTGTKLGSSAGQKISLWGATPIVQPTTSVSAATFAANTSGIANNTATWGGYTMGQVVQALKNIGALA